MTFIRRTLLIIFAVLLCILIWWVGPLFTVGFGRNYHPLEPVWIRVVLIVLILSIVLWPLFAIFLSFIFRYITRPFTNSHDKTKNKDRLYTRFYDALATLKRSGINNKKSLFEKFLYIYNKPYINSRPWYLVLGDESSGKTSMIFQSGENFLHSESYGGIGQTASIGDDDQDCNIWISDRAVYVDTSGGWLKNNNVFNNSIRRFLKLIKRHRRSSKIDGIIICIDASWLKKANITELKNFSEILRVKIKDISNILCNDIPVYFFINKIDLLPGAKEFLYMFNDEIIKHGLGLSAPDIEINGRSLDYFKSFSSRYTEWSKKLSTYLLEILNDTLDDHAREYLFNFIETLGSLRNTLFQIVEQSFPSFPSGYSGYLHDIWYGTTISLKTNDYDQNPKMLGQIFYPAFTRLINTRGFLQKLGIAQKKWSMETWIAYGSLLIFAIFCIVILISKYIWETDYISYVSEKFKEAKRIVKEVQITNKVSDQLIYAYEQLGYINSQLINMKSANRSKSLNPYIEHIFIDRDTKATYHHHLLKFFWPAVENYVTETLSNEIKSGSDEIYNTLRIYQMLAKPEHRSSNEFVNWFVQRWSTFAPNGYTANDKLIFEFHLRELFDGYSKNDTPVIKPNNNLVYQAILKSSELPLTSRIIHRIMELPLPDGIIPVSLVMAAGNNASLMLKLKSNKTVVDNYIPAFYTRAAYKDVFLGNLDKISKDIVNELYWVLNDTSKVNASKISYSSFLQKLKDDTINQYLINFSNTWNKFLKDITIRPIQNLEDSALLANQLANPSSSPLINLIRFVAREVNLTGSQTNSNWFARNATNIENQKRLVIGELSGERSMYRITPERLIEDRFRPILELGAKLNNNIDSNPITKLFYDVYNMIYPLSSIVSSYPTVQQTKQEENVFNQIRIKASNQTDPIKSILLDLISSSESKAAEEIKNSLSNETNSLFTELCNTTIQSKYPFNRSSSIEISRDDFIKMFAPSGTIDQFFKDNVSQLVTGYGDNLKPINSKGNIVDPQILDAFRKVANIKDNFFDQSGKNIKLSMYIRPVSLSSNIYESILDIDGQSINYSHGYTKALKIDWPGPNNNDNIRLVFKTSEGTVKIKNFTGSWSLFRFFDSARIIKSGSDYKIISLSVPGTEGSIELEIKSDMDNFPLWSNILNNFSCP